MPLEPGDKAPEFTLLDQDGEPFTLSESLKQQRVSHLVFFYPKADTPGCTTQACGLRDARADIGATVVLGVSPDPPKRLKRFDEKYGLGFRLLADEDHAVAEAYDVWAEKSMYGKRYRGIVRSAFLIDENGRLFETWYNVSPKATPVNLVQALSV
ncbi:thioredoxin-dependent thiol peroxidase [soil metagenome]